jgi:hypothetical protein
MLCQICLQAEATIHMLDRLSGNPPVEANYCQTCYDLKYVDPPARPPVSPAHTTQPARLHWLPRPRFTIKGMMIVAGLFAILNAAVVLFMRSGLIPGTPAQIRVWTIKAFLVANLSFPVIAVELFVSSQLVKIRSQRLYGGTHAGKPTTRRKLDRQLLSRAGLWKRASRLERLFLILLASWPIMCDCLVLNQSFRSFLMGKDPWVVIPALPLAFFGGMMLLGLGLVASTRRR